MPDLGQRVNNPELALFHVHMLQKFRGLNPRFLFDSVLQPLMADRFQSWFWPASVECPAMYMGGNKSRKIIYIDGATTNAQVSAFIAGYDNGTGPTTTNAFNSYLRDAAILAHGRLTFAGVEIPEYLVLVGYSLGGSIATRLLKIITLFPQQYKHTLLTFGAPRSMGSSAARSTPWGAVARYMTDDDPMPLVPPKLTDAPVLIAAQSVLTNLRWGDYVHISGGLSIAANGVIVPAVIPPVAAMNPGTSLVSWYFAEAQGANNPHALSTYANRLQIAVASVRVPEAVFIPVGHGENVIPGGRQEVNRAQARVAAQIARAGHIQNAPREVVPKLKVFYAVRQGRIWSLAFGNQLVALSPTKKRARGIAAAGNDFLRRLQRQGIVDPAAIIEMMTEFLKVATDPAGGFSPVIRTTLPE